MRRPDTGVTGRLGNEVAGSGPMLDVTRFIPGRDAIPCTPAEDPYRIAWEAAARLPIPDAVDEVARRCGVAADVANLLVFCEVTEASPIGPHPRRPSPLTGR